MAMRLFFFAKVCKTDSDYKSFNPYIQPIALNTLSDM